MNETTLIKVTKAVVEMTGVSRPTLLSWLKNYRLKDGQTLGVHVGGQWRVNIENLKTFMEQGGDKKN